MPLIRVLFVDGGGCRIGRIAVFLVLRHIGVRHLLSPSSLSVFSIFPERGGNVSSRLAQVWVPQFL